MRAQAARAEAKRLVAQLLILKHSPAAAHVWLSTSSSSSRAGDVKMDEDGEVDATAENSVLCLLSKPPLLLERKATMDERRDEDRRHTHTAGSPRH